MEIVAAIPPSDTYLSYLVSKPFWEIFNLFLLGLARIVPTIALIPFLGGKILPDSVKIGFGIGIVIIFLPFLVVNSTTTIQLDITYILLLIKEVFIGFILGFIVSIPFFFTQSAGSLIDHQRGVQSLQVMDPSTQVQTSPTGTLYNNMMLITFFTIGGPLLFFEALLSSYQVIPADQFLSPAFFSGERPLWLMIMELCNTIVMLTLQLSAPAIIAMLMSDLFLGITNRMAPQVQISFLLWSLKAYVGIVMLWAGWWFVLKQFDLRAISWMKMVDKLIETF